MDVDREVCTYVMYVRTDRGNTLCPSHYHAGGIKRLLEFPEYAEMQQDMMMSY